VLISWAAGLTIWVWSAVALNASASRWLRVEVLDVGHGDCLLIHTPRGHVVMVDAGSQEAGRFQVLPFLRAAGIRSLDGLVLTHDDEDHLGGAIPLLQEIRVKRLLTNGIRGDTMSAREMARLVDALSIPHTRLTSGMTLGQGEGVDIRVLHPPAGLNLEASPGSNDKSIVLKLTKGSVSMLLTGDIEEKGLPLLLQASGGSLRSTVLKVPHHGSRLGVVGEEFFRAVSPELVILSVGRLHHLPSAETRQAREQSGAAIYSTREHGAVQLRTDGARLEVRTFRDRRTAHVPLSVGGLRWRLLHR
jgi:competence protein ComEC